MARKDFIHGFWIVWEDVSRPAIDYLRYDLQQGEVKALFDAARLDGTAEFEDDADRDWTILYNRDGTYTITPRQRE